jgi:hypothetical protein
MLERKEALLSALRDLNGQAESMSSLAAARHPSLYSSAFRQQYAWVVAALTKTNAALNPALEKLRLTVFADAQRTWHTTADTRIERQKYATATLLSAPCL